MIAFTHAGPIRGERWSECLAEIRDKNITHLMSAGETAEIDSIQRKEAAEVVSDIKLVAIVDSALTRGLITALSWLGVKVKSYPPAKLDDALKYLGAPGMKNDEIKGALEELRQRSQRPE